MAYIHQCSECGKNFDSKSYKARFCSARCKSAFHYRRRKLETLSSGIMTDITIIAIAGNRDPDIDVLLSALSALKNVREILDLYENVLATKLRERQKSVRVTDSQ